MIVEKADLIGATDRAILKGLYTRNPLRDGLGPVRRRLAAV